LRQLAIHVAVGHWKDVADAIDIGEHWPAQPHQALDQRAGRVERRAGKRLEAGDEDADRSAHALSSNAPIVSAATAGDSLPCATLLSISRTLARIAASARSFDRVRSSSIDHIHFTCCSRRRWAKSPEAVMASRCSRTFCQSSEMPEPVRPE